MMSERDDQTRYKEPECDSLNHTGSRSSEILYDKKERPFESRGVNTEEKRTSPRSDPSTEHTS